MTDARSYSIEIGEHGIRGAALSGRDGEKGQADVVRGRRGKGAARIAGTSLSGE